MSGVANSSVPTRAEDFLGGREQVAVGVAGTGGVEEADKDPLRADADGVVEISCHAFAGENSGDIGAIDFGEDCRHRFNDQRRILAMEERTHV